MATTSRTTSRKAANPARVPRQSRGESSTVYYDTDDLRLQRWGATLSRQRGGTDSGWHLTLPGSDGETTTVSLPLSAGRPGRAPRLMADLVTAMRRDRPLRPLPARRAKRAGSPDIAPLKRPRPKDEAADAVRADLARHARRFLLQDVAVRQDLPESVHDMRVAARHLRSTLRTFGPLVDEAWADHLSDELHWAADQLGPVRDAEVLLRRLGKHAGALPPPRAGLAVRAIDEHFTARLNAARADLLVALRSPRHRALLDALVAAVADPPFTEEARQPCRRALPPLLQHSWKKLAKSVDHLELTSPPEAWHDARKKAKRARYAADLVRPTLTDDKGLANALRGVTDVLGDLHDAHVAEQVLVDLAGSVDGPTGFALGQLASDQRGRALALQDMFWTVWPDARAAHRRWRA